MGNRQRRRSRSHEPLDRSLDDDDLRPTPSVYISSDDDDFLPVIDLGAGGV